MIIFIDESGDAGFKFDKGSSDIFVITLLIFDDELDAEKTAVIIKEFKRKKGFKDNHELKFNKLNRIYRLDFLKCIENSNFRVRSIVVQKKSIYSQKLRADTKIYYNYFLKLVLEHNNNTIKDAKLRLDGFSERKFKQAMTNYLRKSLNKGKNQKIMNNLKFVDSNQNVLIQMADIIAGSIRRYYSGNKIDNKEYREVIKNKIEDEWIFK